MCVIIKNGNVSTGHGSHKADIAIKDDEVFTVDNKCDLGDSKIIDASTVVSTSILHWFNSRH